MVYVIPAVIVVLLVAGFVTFLVLNTTRKGGAVADDEQPPGIGEDRTPLGDTSEHAGEQSQHGATVDDPEQDRGTRQDPSDAAHIGHPGEGEGRERLEFDDERPRSERLADRER